MAKKQGDIRYLQGIFDSTTRQFLGISDPSSPGDGVDFDVPVYSDAQVEAGATGVVASTASGNVVLPSGEFIDSKLKREYLISNYGTVEQAKKYTCSMTAGSTSVIVSGYSFTSDDVGKSFGIKGAGVIGADLSTLANDGVYLATIVSVTAGTGNAVLSIAATNTVSGADCVFGRPIDSALSAAIAACKADYAATGVPGTIVIPAGRYIASIKQQLGNYMAVKGVGRDITQVYYFYITSDADNSTFTGFLAREQSYASAGFYSNLDITDITLIGTYFAATSGYGTDMKMIHINNTRDSRVQRVKIVDNPSTAIGYDMSYNCLIADNIILNAGRLARPTSNHGSAGGSAIGVAIGDADVGDVQFIIRNNFISGKWTALGGTGRSGINIEAAAGTVNPPSYYGGFIVEGNIVEGMYNGVVVSGGIGTIVSNNLIRRVTHGIKAGTNGISNGRAGRDMVIIGNRISKLFSPDASLGLASAYSIGIYVNTLNQNSFARTLITGNSINECANGYGIQVYGASTSYPAQNITITNNHVMDNGLSGIRLIGTLKALIIMGNQIGGNGKALVSSDRAGVKINASATWTDGIFKDNLYTDYDASYQVNEDISVTATLTNVSR